MLLISEFRVLFLHLDYLQLHWSIEPTAEDIGNYGFSILRSGGETGPWEVIIEDIDGFTFQDRDVSMYNTYRRYYYMIRITNRETGQYSDHGPNTVAFQPDNVALEMVRKKNVYLIARTGLPVLLYQKKKFGQYCPNCYDPIKQRSKTSNCKVCYGTNFAGGYWNPVDMYINRNIPESEQYLMASSTEKQQNTMMAETSNFPEVSSGDMIYFPQVGTRYRVINVRKNQRMGFTVSQYMSMTEINRSDVEYTFPVERGL